MKSMWPVFVPVDSRPLAPQVLNKRRITTVIQRVDTHPPAVEAPVCPGRSRGLGLERGVRVGHHAFAQLSSVCWVAVVIQDLLGGLDEG